MPRTKSSDSSKRDVNMNVKFKKEEYTELQKIASELGLSLSAMIRMVILGQLEKVKKSGNPRDFIIKK